MPTKRKKPQKIKHLSDEEKKAYRSAYKKDYNARNPDVRRKVGLRFSYGITLEEYNEMHTNQNGLCALCSKPETQMRQGKLKMLCVDHSHTTNKIRGLLCNRCNIFLGLYEDRRNLISRVEEYLGENK